MRFLGRRAAILIPRHLSLHFTVNKIMYGHVKMMQTLFFNSIFFFRKLEQNSDFFAAVSLLIDSGKFSFMLYIITMILMKEE